LFGAKLVKIHHYCGLEPKFWCFTGSSKGLLLSRLVDIDGSLIPFVPILNKLYFLIARCYILLTTLTCYDHYIAVRKVKK